VLPSTAIGGGDASDTARRNWGPEATSSKTEFAVAEIACHAALVEWIIAAFLRIQGLM
jgi:hypothetical protein